MTVLAEVLVDTTAIPEVTFVRPILGLGEARRFTLDAIDDQGVLFSLRSLEVDGLRLVVATPGTFFADYAPEIDDDAVAALGLLSPDDARLFVVLTVGQSLASSTANLLAPIVVNTVTMTAMQVLLSTADLPLRAPLAG